MLPTRKARSGRKAKSTALQPRSLTSLNLPVDTTSEWVDEDVLEVEGPAKKKTKKLRKSFTREFKLKAVTLVSKNRMHMTSGSKVPVGIRSVSKQLGISRCMLQRWIAKEDKIVASRKGSRTIEKARVGQWSEMEAELHAKFKAVRAAGKPVGQRWFLRSGKRIFQLLYPNQVHVDESGTMIYKCQFSVGWFTGFQERWNISWRIRTKVSQKTPLQKEPAVQRFLQEVRRKSQPQNPDISTLPRFQLCHIYNMDQTPLPFEFLQTRTYDTKGTTTVLIKSEHVAWTKRQATLMLTACADGVLRCKPILIFHGHATKESKTRRLERERYSSDVHVYFNPTAYSNQSVTIEWLQRDIRQIPDDSVTPLSPQPQRLVVMDIFTGQKNAKVFKLMKEWDITAVYIPDGCTGYVQPMDTIINKLVKDKIGDILEETLVDDLEEVVDSTSVGERRIAITHAVAAAWSWLHQYKQDNIIKAFQQTGISLCPTGNEDHKLQVRGLPNLIVGPWELELESDEEIEFVDEAEIEPAMDV